MSFLKRINIKKINITRAILPILLIVGWSDLKALAPILPWFLLLLILDVKLDFNG